VFDGRTQLKIHPLENASAAIILTLACLLAPAASAQTRDSTSADTTAQATPALLPAPLTPPTGPDFPRGRISGYAFGDVYWNATGDPRHAYSASGSDSGKVNLDSSGKPITQDLNGVQVRRIYFQLDNDLSIR